MKHKLLAVFALLFLVAFGVKARERTVSGNVTSSEVGTSIPGVNVVVKGTSIGTITDIDGNFALLVPSDESVLVFSYIGLATGEIMVGTRSTIDLTMKPDLTQLNELVVVVYGTQSKQALTGAIGVVNADVIKNQQIVSVGRALQGTTHGELM
jgi:hypothetical protein